MRGEEIVQTRPDGERGRESERRQHRERGKGREEIHKRDGEKGDKGRTSSVESTRNDINNRHPSCTPLSSAGTSAP